MRRIVLAVALVVASAVPALAQPSLTPISDPEEPPAAPRSVPAEPKQLSESTATLLAVGTTVGGFALAAASVSYHSAPLALAGAGAIFVGPSAGHIYAGEGLHAVGMSALRFTGATLFVYGVVRATVVEELGPSSASSSTRDGGRGFIVLGAATYLGATLYDLYDAHRAARRTNRERAAVVVAPTMTSQSSGIALAGSF